MKFTSFSSATHRVFTDNMTGTWFIEEKGTEKITNRFVYNEGMEQYKSLKRLYRVDRSAFDRVCVEYISRNN